MSKYAESADFGSEMKGPDKILSALGNINSDQGQVLLPRNMQNKLIEKRTGVQVNNPYSVGPALMRYSPKKSVPVDQTMFYGHYANGDVAKLQHDAQVRNTDDVLKKFAGDLNPEDRKRPCRTFAPLRVSYDGGPDLSDKVIAAVVLKGGEIKRTATLVPDIVFTFFGVTGVITMTICLVREEKARDLAIAVTALYAMDSRTPLSIENFEKLYDAVRRKVVDREAIHNR